jgi:gliding motility-associated-like protein
VQIINPVITSPSNYYSSFTAFGTNLGLNSGILLTTGDYSVAIGPNNQIGAATVDNNPGDPTLQAIAGVNTYDAAVLEFDFIPQNDTIQFNYVFASEEYPEYVCSTYNDLFGFFISGPGIIGTQNLATIPGTNIPVAINTVNIGSPGANANANTPCNLSYPIYYSDNFNSSTIQFDGFTTNLTALAVVTPCQTYHLKIVIADAGDADYDSGVFLKEGSLSSTPNVYAGPDGGYCTGTVRALGLPPSPGWTYSWSPSTGISNPNISNPNVTLINTGGTVSTTNYVVTASNGTCQLTDTVILSTIPIPTSTFTPINDICLGDTITINYTGNAANTANYHWTLGGATIISGSGQGPILLTYPTQGNYSINLGVEYYGCPQDPEMDSINVVSRPNALFILPDSICEKEITIIQNTGINNTGVIYTWNFGTGTTLNGTSSGPYSVQWNTPGPSSVQINIDNQICSSSYSEPIYIKSNPVFDITVPPSICSIDTATIIFTGSVSLTSSYFWDTGISQIISGTNSGPLFVYPTTSGIDTIKLTVNDSGCSITKYKTFTIIEQPIASYVVPNSICSGDSAIFNFNGSSAGSPAISWSISTGNPSAALGIGPISSKFNIPGKHPVSLLVNNSGCKDLYIDTINVKATPIANISGPSSICSNDTLVLAFSGSASSTSQYNWMSSNVYIGNNTSTNYNLSPLVSGIDTIQVIVNDNGCIDTSSKSIQVYQQPLALLNITSQVCVEDSTTIYFAGNSATAASLNWNIIGGYPTTSSSLSQITTSFLSPGNHIVSISINNAGCRDSLTDTIIVNPLPLVDFTSGDVCNGVPVSIQNNSSISSGNINSYSWIFGDLQSSTLPQPGSHTYSSSGNYTIVLAAISDKFCRDTLAVNLTIHDNPISIYSVDSICAGNATTFTDSSYIASGTIDHRYFYYNNSIIGIDSIFNYTFNGYGSYPTMLVTESDFGCRDTSYQTAIVHSLPAIDLTGLPRSGCQPLDVQFENQATNIDGSINNIIWNFGDGDSSNFNDPSHTYLTSGLFDVSLTAISEYGCSKDSTFANYIEVYPKPIADFIHDPAPADMLSPVVYFTNQTTLADQYLWNLGDSTITTESDPVHQYNAAGTYLVELIATNDDGCKDTVTGEVIINPSFTLYVPNAFSPNNDGKNDVFLCQGIGIDKFKMKIFNRWGNHVCTLYNIDEPWDGTDDGKVAQEETYVYLIEVTDVLKQIHTVTGRVSIIK